MKTIHKILFILMPAMLFSCEKEITVDLPKSTQEYVVEASINQRFLNLNYVFISKSVDYFNPDLTLGGIKGANVFITEGAVNGSDTLFNGTRTQMFDVSDVPGFDSVFKGLSGIYLNLTLTGKENTPYLLEIQLPDGNKITGKTFIPKSIPIDTVKYQIRDQDENQDGYKDAFVTVYYTDPPEQNNYRMAMHNDTTSIMLGWGSADSYRTFDDELINNAPRFVNYNNPFQQGDTLNFYLNTLGRKEFLFWQSFGRAANNGGPFATPVTVKSNITGAIGSFTGYGCSFKQVILK